MCVYIHTQSSSCFLRGNKDFGSSKGMYLPYFIYTRLLQEIKSILENIKVPVRQSNALEWKCFRVNHGCATSLPKLILNQKSDRPRTLSDGGLLRDAVQGIGLDCAQSFLSKLVVVPFQIVRVVFFCFVALEKQVDGKLLSLVWSTHRCSIDRANQTGKAFWYSYSAACSVARLTTGSCLQFRQEEISNFVFLKAY